ncbi:MAG TPA: peptide ABC transporter permease [Ruminococcaceae bacterium]|jgi:oligopeptide transport system permease protein|nr:peptide ABC transporter permease [Oscillospiraceae bacterium]HBQ45730.1 peptide ABC transporter permease [Oscillospiraceae bacterium]HBT91687.1 peptide ABC transporter permease [Oscillospiraceae bacterium]
MKNRWLRFLGRRLLYMALTLWIIVTITFLLMSFLPGTPYNNQDKLTAAQLQVLNQKYGLNQPVWQRYLTYLNNILHGDFGISLQFSDQKVTTLLGNRVGVSMQLGIQAAVFGTVVGIVLGTIAAMKHNTWIDTFCSLFAIVGRSAPNFVVAVLLQFVFAVTLGVLPIGLWNEGFRSTVLPTLALSISPMADSARFIRTEMLEVLNSDYIEFARAKGMSELHLVVFHGLRNALIPLITILGPITVSLMTGSLVVENIFAVPGIGEQFTKSVLTNDYYTIMAMTILFSALLVVVIFLTDILYQIIDPRVRIGGDRS